jgi:uncharacterized membrane protein
MQFNRNYFTLAILLFLIEVCIALFVNDNFIRPYIGDVLVVILMYCAVKSVFNLPVMATALGVLLLSFGIELLQYANFIEKIGLETNTLARTILGHSYSVEDLMAYTIGVIVIITVEKLILEKQLQ